ncbi:hypothetical protein BH20ACT15_BH20ACT15_15710 [soil metagenome]
MPINSLNRAQLDDSLLCLTNAHRVQSGVAPVALDTRLAVAARAHSEDMVARNYFDPARPPVATRDRRDRAASAPAAP